MEVAHGISPFKVSVEEGFGRVESGKLAGWGVNGEGVFRHGREVETGRHPRTRGFECDAIVSTARAVK
jgi:hypothetical protein